MKRKLLYRTTLILSVILFGSSLASTAQAQGGLDQRITELSQQIAIKMSAKQKTTIAVIEFTDLQGNVTDFGRFLAEELITRLYGTEKFKVIERQLLNKIIAEQKLSLTGVVDPASAKHLGRILGVEAIAAGTVTNLAQNLKVNARLISTETGEIFAVAATEIFKDESVTQLLANAGSTSSRQASQAPSSPQSKPDKPTFETDSYRVVVEETRKRGDRVIVTFAVENLSDRRFDISWSGPRTYLLDENGEKWGLPGFDRDSAGIIWQSGFGPATVLPGTKLRSRVQFTPYGSTNGTVFTLAAEEGQPRSGRQVLIRGLRAVQ